uniref:OTU domain-containing protein n=1 Tax=viral metagenome TaxID=1070528 RepID=A0A6C0DRH6_9ZZZZ
MVKSKINKDINYPEKREIDDEDVGYESQMYEYIFNNKTIEIALGKQKYIANNTIIYLPIYIVINEHPLSRIGVFEVETNQFINILDKDGDVDLTKGKILFFSFADAVIDDLLKKYTSTNNDESDTDEYTENDEIAQNKLRAQQSQENSDSYEEAADDDNGESDVLKLKLPKNHDISDERKKINSVLDDGIFITEKDFKQPAILAEETAEDAEKLKGEYLAGPRNNWVETFMNNNHYGINETEDNGDCFFATIRDAFAQVGKKTTVAKLRAAIAKEVTDEQYVQYRTLYVTFANELQLIEKKIKDNKRTVLELKKRLVNSSREESPIIREEAKQLLQHDKTLNAEKAVVSYNLKEFSFMADIDSIEKFQKFIQTSSFWADTWAISTLERILNIKVVIMGEESFKRDELDNVLQCGQLNDTFLENRGLFSPEFYIIMCYSGLHYELVTYKSKRIFKFSEIPYGIKALVINKCLEKNAGPYYLIQDFRNFKENLGLDPDLGSPEEKNEIPIEVDLYDPETILVFHSKSDSTPLAGKGFGEKIETSRIAEFSVLDKDKDCLNWRRKLDDSWVAPLTVDGKRWNTVEHYVLGSQYKKGFPDFFNKFSLDSESDISKDTLLAKAAVSKSGKIKDLQLRPKNVRPDLDYEEKDRKNTERKTAIYAKFSQNQDLLKVLKETKNAKLMHFVRGSPSVTDDLLMKVRSEL